MPEPVRYEVRNRVAVITVDNPPVNALSPGVAEAIEAAVARAVADDDARAAVLIGAGSTFIAGADIRFFSAIPGRDASLARSRAIHARLRAIEDCPKPLVSAIHGTALGGGMEIAMACHYRVALRSAKVGQPEVAIGLIPGAAGTQRLPRLAGLDLAIQMCTAGHHVPAERAFDNGLIDRLLDGDLLEGAIAFALEQKSPWKARDLPIRGDDSAFEPARAKLGKSARGAHAPFAALEAIETGFRHGFDAGCEREIQLFAECVLSRESRHMIRLFFAEREAARVPDVPKDTPAADIRLAAVVGAGTMGGGIAMSYANAGIPVLLQETDRAALDRGLDVIRRNYESSISKGRLSRGECERNLALIRPVLNYDGFRDADIVVEAVFEDFELKRSVFAELGQVTRPDSVLASNTSTLDIDAFAAAAGRPESVIGHHFFSPANVMKLIEIVRGAATSRETIATSLKLARRLGKIGVVVGNCFGFVANRMIAYYMREAYLLLEEGASVPQIDRVHTGFGLPVGPFAMQDIAGIDVGARIRNYLRSIGKTRAAGPQSVVPDMLYEMGRYGQKTGAGWYRYDHGSRAPIPDPIIDELAAKAAAERGIHRRAVPDEEIISRVTAALANEGANILEQGFAARPGDIDVIFAYGFGFPRHRGGPMAYADEVGLPEMLRRVRDYRHRFGSYWTPAPLLERLAAEGRGFYDAAPAPARLTGSAV